MSLTVLSDDQVRAVLEDLTLDELDEFRHELSSALHEFSTGMNSEGGQEAYQQPHRITTRHPETCATTLYMPSCGPGGMGCKVVSLTKSEDAEKPDIQPISPTGVLNLFSPEGRLTGVVNASTLTAFRTALASACLVLRRNHVRTITVFGSGAQAYWHVRLALMMRGSSVRHVHVINRRFSERAGLMLKRFTVVPRHVKQREGWEDTKFSILTPTFHDFERLQREHVRNADVIFCCTPSREDLFDGHILTTHDGRKKGRLIVAVGSFTPHMREIPESLLLQATKTHDRNHRHFHKHAEEGGVIIVDTLEGALKEAGEIISAKIGPNQLVELGELVMLHRLEVEQQSESDTASTTSSSTNDLEKLDLNSSRPSMSSVYPSEQTTTSSGRSTPRSGSPSRSESPSRRKASIPNPFRMNSHGSSSDRNSRDSDSESKQETALARWLRDGTVIYKSVGLGLMDLVVGAHLVKVAKKKEIGTQVGGF